MENRCYGCMQPIENHDLCEHCGHDQQIQNSSHQLPVGTVVGGQYTLGKVLGQGGFGITYIGWDHVLNQRVAVKEFFPSGHAGRDSRSTLEVTSYDNKSAHDFETNKRRFLREAESLAKLWNIPQIIKVLRHFEEHGTAYIAMEFAEGTDLRHYLKDHGRPMTMEELLDVLGPIIQALSHVHNADLVHRDISPDNIMVLPNGGAKLLDFGAARYVENADAEKDRNTSTQAILKHGFAPPEQYRSHGALGPWTDIYAMCATVYFCLCGKIPPESMSRMMGEADLNLDKIPGLTQQQKDALERGMALIPKARIRTAEELYQALFGEILEAREKAAREEKERLAREEAQRKLEEERQQKERARKEAEERIALEKQKAAEEKERLRQEAKKRKAEKRKAGKDSGKKSPVGKVLAAAAAAAVLAACIFFLNGNKTSEPEPVMQKPAVAETTLSATVEPVQETVPVTESAKPLDIVSQGYLDIVSQVHLDIVSQVYWEVPEIGDTRPALPVNTDSGSASLIWSSSNPEVVTVSDDGQLTSVGYGAADITVQLGSRTGTCHIILHPSANVTCTYTAIGDSVRITGYEGTLPADAVLPTTIEGKPVVNIAENAFSNCRSITSIHLPYGLKTIDDEAFRNCSNLTAVYIPDTVHQIGKSAFRECGKLKSVDLPDSLKLIDEYVFAECRALASVTFPAGLTQINYEAFYSCSSLTEVVLPYGFTTLDSDVFDNCTSLVSVTIPETVTSIGNEAFLFTPWLNNTTEEFLIVGDGILIHYSGSDSHVEIPGTVKSIVDAFSGNTTVRSVVIPNGVTCIGDSAFYRCPNLSEVSIPGSVTTIGTSAFSECLSLRSIVIPEGVTTLEWGVFRRSTNLKEVTLPSTLQMMDMCVFYECRSLTSITLPDGIIRLDDYLFYGCSALTSVDLPQSLTRIGYHTFEGCSSLAELTLPPQLRTVDSTSFTGCHRLKNVSMSSAYTSIQQFLPPGCTVTFYDP